MAISSGITKNIQLRAILRNLIIRSSNKIQYRYFTSSQWKISSLSNETAIVTGSSSGIGKAVSSALTLQGCAVVGADVTEPYDTHDSLSTFVHCDVSEANSVKNFINLADEVANRRGRNCASILVNAAGMTSDSLMQNMTDEMFDEVIAVNLRGTYLTCRYFSDPKRIRKLLPREVDTFTARQSIASIVNIASIVGKAGNIGQVNYAASKAGVVGLTKALAKELASMKIPITSDEDSRTITATIRANVILPGFIDTPMSRAMPDHVREKLINKSIGMKRMGNPEEVANLAVFLASDMSSYMTGAEVALDGGIII